jgi:hypothetical protein
MILDFDVPPVLELEKLPSLLLSLLSSLSWLVVA